MTAIYPETDRFIGRLPGRYVLTNRRAKSGLKVFACLTQSVSIERVVLMGPVAGSPGDPVSANIDQVGLIEGHVERPVDGGLAVAVCPRSTDGAALRRRVNWLRRWGSAKAEDQRGHKRFLPRVSRSCLVLGDGTQLGCHVINVSNSGAALSADLVPRVGEPLAVGSVVARVVRVFDCGFAVKFLEDLPREDIEARLVSPGDTDAPVAGPAGDEVKIF